MNIQPLLEKFTSGKQQTACILVVAQPSALFFSAPATFALPEQVHLEGATWQASLIKTLQESKVANVALKLVLDASLYQTFQIDKPNIPEEELKSALPFLVKDLISERVTDIVADAAPLMTNNKLQVYVIPRSLIAELHSSLKGLKIDLTSVLVEDEVWGHSAGELNTFLLLQRSKQGQFRISAFVESQCAFQRTIRGVVAPLTGIASSALQLDSLALELQRSTDYLSSQMRSVSLHQMKVCCDEEQQQDLIDSLSESLSVNVSALSEQEKESGALLVECASQLEQIDINLFPADLNPKQDLFTLQNVALGWLVTAVLFGVAFAAIKFQHNQLERELRSYQSQETGLTQQAEVLTQQLAEHKPSAAKMAAIARLKQEIDAKRATFNAIEGFDESQRLGYSGVMRSLAQLGRNDISLSSITINAAKLDLVGVAREAKAIPNWVNQFKTELNLVGRTFEKLKIGRNEEDLITFELKTQQESK